MQITWYQIRNNIIVKKVNITNVETKNIDQFIYKLHNPGLYYIGIKVK